MVRPSTAAVHPTLENRTHFRMTQQAQARAYLMEPVHRTLHRLCLPCLGYDSAPEAFMKSSLD